MQRHLIRNLVAVVVVTCPRTDTHFGSGQFPSGALRSEVRCLFLLPEKTRTELRDDCSCQEILSGNRLPVNLRIRTVIVPPISNALSCKKPPRVDLRQPTAPRTHLPRSHRKQCLHHIVDIGNEGLICCRSCDVSEWGYV